MAYALRRVGLGIVVLWGAFTGAFLLLQVVPGNAIINRFENPSLGLTPSQIVAMKAQYGASSPIWAQYFHTAWSFLQGDFGNSEATGYPVARLVDAALPHTFELAGLGLVLAVLIATAVSYVSGLARLSWLRELLRSLPSLFAATPPFWLAIALIEIFSFRLKLVPVVNPGPLTGLILPTFAIGIPAAAPLAQVLTRSIDEILLSPFIEVSAAKGATRQWLLWKDVARNAVLPILTMAGVLFGALISSAVITETIFGLSGLGLITTAAVTAQDTPVIEAVVVISAAGYVVVNLLVDLLFPLLDPRLKRQVGRAS